MFKEDQPYTVVVSSCDEYEDLWYPFFAVLKAEWPELEQEQIPIVLNTENKKFEYSGLNILSLGLYKPGDSPSWTERLRKTLESIDSRYIIMLLDDFFMQNRVKIEEINRCVRWMDDNPKITTFCFKETFASKNIKDNRYEGFERRPLIGEYKLNCQAALWRRDRLIKYLKKDENPWEWETLGNWRSYRHPSHFFYSAVPGCEHVFPYIYILNGKPMGGMGVLRGKWYLPCVEEIFKKHGIEIDYSIRGTVTEEDLNLFTGKNKKETSYWKRKMWFAVPLYNGIKRVLKTILIILKNLDHFF